MRKRIGQQWKIIAVNAVVILTMGLLLSRSNADSSPELWLLLVLFMPPVIAIMAVIFIADHRSSRIAYLMAAILMLPAVGLGIFGGWGLMYAIAIIFLLMAARK